MKKNYDDIFENLCKKKYIKEASYYINKQGLEFKGEYGGQTIDTPILAASITKLFTTTVIFILIKNNRLKLTDKIYNFFTKEEIDRLHIYKSVNYTKEITIENLLFQNSGLPDISTEGDKIIKKIINTDMWVSFDEALSLTKSIKTKFKPGNKKSHYADINFDILGKIIEQITEKELSKVFDEYIFQPLNLKNSFLPTSINCNIPYTYYKKNKLNCPKIIVSSKASGGVVTTIRELMIFIKAFYKGVLFDTEFLNFDNFYKVQSSMGPIKYGLGHMVISLGTILTAFAGDGKLYGHSGSTGSFAFYYPNKDMFICGNFSQMALPSLPIVFILRASLL